ncbi:ATP-dependent DNA helicase PIF1-like protein [Tanacetum coccineum]
MQEVRMIIWDEALMTQKYDFQALDITLRDILGYKNTKKEIGFLRHDGVARRVNEYFSNGDIDTAKQDFNKWVLAVGDGELPAKLREGDDKPTWIKIPKKLLIKS